METLIHDDEIKLLLQPFGIDKLHHSDDVLIAIKANFTIVYVNFGWYRFAANNGGMTQEALIIPFGRSLFDFIPEALHPFFKYHFSVCLESRQPWQHKYECSTGEVFREYLMTVYPLGEGQGFLISHSLAFSGPHDRQSCSPIERNYFSPSGVIVQCVHCRRVKRSDANLSWDWVPEWVTATHPNVSHGVCETCVTYYYPGGKIPADGYYPKMVQSAGLPALQDDEINEGS